MHAVSAFLLFLVSQPVESRPLTIQITFSKKVAAEPFTGRVFLIAARGPISGAPPSQSWFKPFPFFAQEVRQWRPEEPLTFKPQHAFPVTLDKLPAEKLYLQAVMDMDRGGMNCLAGPGNLYSKAIVLDPKAPPDGPL